jgi:hypothetical protein
MFHFLKHDFSFLGRFSLFQAMKMGRTRQDTQVVVKTWSFSQPDRLEERKVSQK